MTSTMPETTPLTTADLRASATGSKFRVTGSNSAGFSIGTEVRFTGEMQSGSGLMTTRENLDDHDWSYGQVAWVHPNELERVVETPTYKPAADYSEGDKVRVLRNGDASTASVPGVAIGLYSFAEHVGQTVTVISQFREHGLHVRAENGTTFYVGEGQIEPVLGVVAEPGATLTPEPRPLAVGDKVRRVGPHLACGGTNFGDRECSEGSVGTVTIEGPGPWAEHPQVHVLWDETGRGSAIAVASLERVGVDLVRKPKPEVDAAEAARLAMVERADAAEKELADYRVKVREALISEVERHGWTDSLEGWLDTLGLPSALPEGFPTTENSVVTFEEEIAGETVLMVAVHDGSDSEPWQVKRADGKTDGSYYTTWRSNYSIGKKFKAVIHNAS